MRKYIGLIAIIVVTTIVLAACSDGENNDAANNNENSVETKTEDKNSENENKVTEDENDSDNETNKENGEGGDLDAYGEHEIKRHLSHLSYEDEKDDIVMKVTDINVGEIEINEESKIMFQDEDTAATRGLKVNIENQNDKPITFNTNDIKFITTDDKPGLEPEPLMSDPLDEYVEIDAGDSLESMMYFLEDGHTEDMDDFKLEMHDILLNDEEALDDLSIDIDIKE